VVISSQTSVGLAGVVLFCSMCPLSFLLDYTVYSAFGSSSAPFEAAVFTLGSGSSLWELTLLLVLLCSLYFNLFSPDPLPDPPYTGNRFMIFALLHCRFQNFYFFLLTVTFQFRDIFLHHPLSVALFSSGVFISSSRLSVRRAFPCGFWFFEVGFSVLEVLLGHPLPTPAASRLTITVRKVVLGRPLFFFYYVL